MDLIKWMFGLKTKLDEQGERLVNAVKRAADAWEDFAQRSEEITGGNGTQQTVPQIEAPTHRKRKAL